MAVRPIVKMGTPNLFEKSLPWPQDKFDSPELHALLADMKDSMVAASGAGLAAPQIGENVRVVIFEVDDNPRYPDREPIPFTVLINPDLTPVSAEQVDDWEGCLSVPGMRGLVPRYPTLIVSVGAALIALLSFVCGLVLDTVSRARLEQRRLAYLALPGPGAPRS